jgi:hypothetical protein
MEEQAILEALSKVDIIGTGRIKIKTINYKDGGFAPESEAYIIYYPSYTHGRRKVAYWPNTIGFQWYY